MVDKQGSAMLYGSMLALIHTKYPRILLPGLCLMIASVSFSTEIVEESFLPEYYGPEMTLLAGLGAPVPGLQFSWEVVRVGNLRQDLAPSFIPQGLSYTDASGRRLRNAGGAIRLIQERNAVGSWNAHRLVDLSPGSPLRQFSSDGQFVDQGKIYISFLVESWSGNAPFQSTIMLGDSSHTNRGYSLHLGFINSSNLEGRAISFPPDELRPITLAHFGRHAVSTRPNLIIAAVDFQATPGPKVDIWVNPRLGSEPTPDGSFHFSSPGFRFDRLIPRITVGNVPHDIEAIFDEIRLGSTFSSVTPFE